LTSSNYQALKRINKELRDLGKQPDYSLYSPPALVDASIDDGPLVFVLVCIPAEYPSDFGFSVIFKKVEARILGNGYPDNDLDHGWTGSITNDCFEEFKRDPVNWEDFKYHRDNTIGDPFVEYKDHFNINSKLRAYLKDFEAKQPPLEVIESSAFGAYLGEEKYLHDLHGGEHLDFKPVFHGKAYLDYLARAARLGEGHPIGDPLGNSIHGPDEFHFDKDTGFDITDKFNYRDMNTGTVCCF